MENIVLVFSDSHGSVRLMRQALADHPSADIIHLGDGIDDMTFLDTRGREVYTVFGNLEEWQYPHLASSKSTFFQLIDLFGTKTLIMHGHRASVKDGIEKAVAQANAAGADLLLHGHTHLPVDIYLPAGRAVGGTVLSKPLRVFNPGSVGRGEPPSYGILTFRGGELLTSHCKK